MFHKIKSFLFRTFAIIAFLSLICGMVGIRPVQAATLTVSDCSAPSGAPERLVEVIAAAGSGDTVNFSCSGTITLDSTLNFSKDLTLDGSGQTVVLSGGGLRRVAYMAYTTVTLNHLTITAGSADYGAGIYNDNGTLTVIDSTVSDNIATQDGAGIYNLGTLTVTDTTLSGNSATWSGGGIYATNHATLNHVTLSGNSAYDGGGIYNFYILAVTNSTLSNNSASYGGGISNQNLATLNITGSTLFNNSAAIYGGGIYNANSATVTNNTLVENSSSVEGGGVYNNGTLTITNSTFSGNRADYNGGGIFQSAFGTLNFSNTIATNSPSGGDCYLNGATLGTHAHNLVVNNVGNSCGAAIAADPQLGPLANNGGLTQTMALLTGSPAIDMGASCPTNDQRGLARQGAACDIGAYEYQPKEITAFDFTSQAAVGVISPTTIAVTVPYATDPSTLVPTITHTGASVSPASGATQDFTSPVVYTVTAADGTTRSYTVTVTVALNPAKSITAFTIAGQQGGTTINEGAGTIALTMPYATDVTALVPTLTHTGASVDPGSEVAQNFTSPVVYTVTAEDGTTKAYSVTVTVAPNPAKAITAFTIAGQIGGTTIDEGAGTITLLMPYATNLTALSPTITHTGASVSPASGAAQNFTNPVVYTVTAADATTKTYTVTLTVALNPAKAITALSIPSQVGGSSINEGAGTIVVTMPYGTDVTALVPAITHTGAAINPPSGVAQNFTSPVVYTVTAADGTSKTYTVTVTMTLNPAKAITAFTIAGQRDSTIDEAAGTIAVTMPFGTNPSALAPTITHTGVSVNPASGVARDFRYGNPVFYTVTAANSTTKVYRATVTVDCLNLTVTNANDSGAGSLRQAIADTCSDGTITFDPALSGTTIPLLSQLTLSKNVTIDGSALATPITISGGGTVRVFYVNLNVTAAIKSFKIINGNPGATSDGGGIYNYGTLTLTNSTLSGNSAQFGGAIYNDRVLTVTNSTFSGNTASFIGGAVHNAYRMSISNSTLVGNTAYGGGGIYNMSTLSVSNSTFVGNNGGMYGGGISTSGGGSLTVANSTFSGNGADRGGAIYISPTGTMYYSNTILANSSIGGDCWSYGVIGSNSHNLVEDNFGGSCGAAMTADPKLGPLASNGGLTQTMGLGANSPAIDAGDQVVCDAGTVNKLDQRGQARNDYQCDIGAFELKFADSPTVTKTISGPATYTFGPALVKIAVNNTGGCLTGITVQRYNNNHLNATTPLKTGSWWAITPSGCTSGFDVNLTLPTSFAPAGDGTDKLCRHVSGWTWDCAYTSSTANSITRANVTAFSDWAAGDNSGTTAVTLHSLTARSESDLSGGVLTLSILGFFAMLSISKKHQNTAS